MGCFYGPYIYVVLPLGGLYLAADGLLLHAVRGGGHHQCSNIPFAYTELPYITGYGGNSALELKVLSMGVWRR